VLYRFLVVAIVPAVLVSGCKTHGDNVLLPEPRPLGSGLIDIEDRNAGQASPAGIVTLQTALAEALLKNPRLAAFSWEIPAAEARLLQAGLRPNPELEGEIEEFGGSAERQAAISAALGRLVERLEKDGSAAAEKPVATETLGEWKSKLLGAVTLPITSDCSFAAFIGD